MSRHARRWLAVFGVFLGLACSSPVSGDRAQPVPAGSSDPVAQVRESLSPPSPPVTAADAAVIDAPPVAPRSGFPDHLLTVSRGVAPGLGELVGEQAAQGLWWVGPLVGNGERDVAIFMPASPRPDAHVRLVYHFHGTYSQNINKEAPGVPKKQWVGWNRLVQTATAISALQASEIDNVALVYPISAGKRIEPEHKGWSNKAYDRMWMVPTELPGYRDSFATLHQEATTILVDSFGVQPKLIRPKVTAEGHSAGGIALRNIAVAGSEHVGEYIFQDASFQDWADGCFMAVQTQKRDALVTLVVTEAGIADPFAGRRDPWCADLPRDSAAWQVHKSRCGSRMSSKPGGGKRSCQELRDAFEKWPQYESWCAAYAKDMKTLPGVYLHRTRVPHGKQPGHFSGGLELPKDRFVQEL